MRGKDKERGWEMPDNRAGGDRRQSVTDRNTGKEANKRNSTTSSSVESSTMMAQDSVEQMPSQLTNQYIKDG